MCSTQHHMVSRHDRKHAMCVHGLELKENNDRKPSLRLSILFSAERVLYMYCLENQ